MGVRFRARSYLARTFPWLADAYRKMHAVAAPTPEAALRAISRVPLPEAVARVEIDPDGVWFVDQNGLAWMYSTETPIGTGFGLEEGHFRELREYELIRSLARPGAVFIDIGANVGTFSVRLAHDVDDLGVVIAVEPVAHTCSLLRKNAMRNSPDIQVHHAAIGEASGEIQVTSEQGTGNHIVLPGEMLSAESITLRTVDDLVDEHRLDRVDIIKCDVEGAELSALRGAAWTLSRFGPHLIVEIEQRWTERYGYDASDVFAFLAGAGYETFERVGGGDRQPEPGWQPADYIAAGGGNFYFPAPST
jgi:FkbM family methyltransferase